MTNTQEIMSGRMSGGGEGEEGGGDGNDQNSGEAEESAPWRAVVPDVRSCTKAFTREGVNLSCCCFERREGSSGQRNWWARVRYLDEVDGSVFRKGVVSYFSRVALERRTNLFEKSNAWKREAGYSASRLGEQQQSGGELTLLPLNSNQKASLTGRRTPQFRIQPPTRPCPCPSLPPRSHRSA